MSDAHVLTALCHLVEERVFASLPAERQTRAARKAVRLQTRGGLVRKVVQELIAEVAAAVSEALDDLPAPFPFPFEGRYSVLDNDVPCRRCQEVRRVAVIEVSDGVLRSVECEACAPEFDL